MRASRPLASSNLSLLGLVRHVAKVERFWFRLRATGQDIDPMYDPARGKDADLDDVDAAHAKSDFDRLRGEWRLADETVAGMAFDDTFEVGDRVFSLRMMYVHLIG